MDRVAQHHKRSQSSAISLPLGSAILSGQATPSPAAPARPRSAIERMLIAKRTLDRLRKLSGTHPIGVGTMLLSTPPKPSRKRKPPPPPIIKKIKQTVTRIAKTLTRGRRPRSRSVARAVAATSSPPGDSDDGPDGPTPHHRLARKRRSREAALSAAMNSWFSWRNPADLEAALRLHYPQRRGSFDDAGHND
jgi:hypothetical protein